MVRPGKTDRLHINILELKAVSLALIIRSFKDQCQNQTVLVAMDNSTVVAYINKQGGTHSAEMCALLWKIMTWCHHYHITLKARHIPGCLNVMANLLSRSNQVQSTEWLLHLQVFKQICQKWFTPHVDLFATHLNHKLSLYVSPAPDPKAWDIDLLNINWMGLTVYAYPPMDFSTPSVKQVSDFFMYLYQDLNRLPRPSLVTGRPLLTLWAQWGTILHKVQTFTGYSPVFTGIVPKVPGIFVSKTFLLFSMSSQKHPLCTAQPLNVYIQWLSKFNTTDIRQEQKICYETACHCHQSKLLCVVPFISEAFVKSTHLAQTGSD